MEIYNKGLRISADNRKSIRGKRYFKQQHKREFLTVVKKIKLSESDHHGFFFHSECTTVANLSYVILYYPCGTIKIFRDECG